MFKAIIADDERKVRSVILRKGEWDRIGIEITGEAENGNQLCEMVDNLHPDIVLTDMRMPGLSGASLIKHLSDKYKGMKIIIISGFDDFEYTKQAITSKVTDYILKPVDSKSLNDSLKNAVAEIEMQKGMQKKALELENTLSGLIKLKAGLEAENNFTNGQSPKNTIYEIKDYIEKNYTEKLSLNNLAVKYFLSKQYISKAFKEEFGINLFEYITKLKIERSKILLLEGNMKVREIVDLLGFTDESHFSNVFRKVTGLSPKEYKERLSRKE